MGANRETGEPDHNDIFGEDSSIWYRWTAPASGDATFDTRASVTGTNVTIYTGNTVSTLTREALNMQNANGELEATFTAQAGTTYHIALDTSMNINNTDNIPAYDTVHGDTVLRWSLNNTPVPPRTPPTITGFTPTTGPVGTVVTITGTGFTGATQVRFNGTPATFTVNSNTSITATAPFGVVTGKITVHTPQGIGTSAANFVVTQAPPPAPANDNFANAPALVFGNAALTFGSISTQAAGGTTTGTNVNATKQTGEPNHAGNAGGKSVWWKWTAPANGTVTFDTAGSALDTLLGFYIGTSVSALTERAQNDDVVTGTTTSRIADIAVTGGTVYYIAVDGYSDTSGIAAGDITLNYSFAATPTGTPGALRFSVSSYSVNESAGTATITVTRTGGSAGTVGVTYATANGTAVAGSDYTTKTGTLSFAAGVTSQTFTIAITNDTLDEADETINLTLSSPTGGATLGTPVTAQITIVDDDSAPGGCSNVFTDSDLEAAAPHPAWTIQTSTTFGTPICDGGCGGGTAAVPQSGVGWAWFGGSETPETSTLGRSITIPSGTTATLRFGMRVAVTAPFTDVLRVKVDGTIVKTYTEPSVSESAYSTRTVDLSAFANGAAHTIVLEYVGVGGTGNVANFNVDDIELEVCPATSGKLSFSAANYSVNESAGTATITVTRTGGSTGAVGVSYATSNSTATAGSDYTTKTGTLSFAAGVVTQTFTVAILNDTAAEPNESINLTLSNATGGATLGTPNAALLTITNDDTVPALAVNNPRSLREGNAGASGSVTFDITLSAASTQSVTVNYQTANGTNNPAIAGSDYTAKTGKLTFAPGETLKRVTISFIGDSAVELNETFFFDLKTPTNATIADNRGVGQINNDDGPGITIGNAVTLDEGSSGTKSQTFTVTLSAASTNTVTVDWTTANNTATTADYVTASGTLSFAPGETSKLINVLVKGDTTVEPNETYKVVLSKVAYAFIADGLGIGTIRNDDGAAPLLFENDEPS